MITELNWTHFLLTEAWRLLVSNYKMSCEQIILQDLQSNIYLKIVQTANDNCHLN